MLKTRYEFWHEWVDQAGRLYADHFDFDVATDARAAHRGALEYRWATGKGRPSVSDLFAVTMTLDDVNGRARLDGRIAIADGNRMAD